MKIHELKAWSEPYDAVHRGDKPYEIRINDRDYAVGDLLHLREFNPDERRYLSRSLLASVTYMTKGGDWGLAENLCVLGIVVLERRFNGERVAP